MAKRQFLYAHQRKASVSETTHAENDAPMVYCIPLTSLPLIFPFFALGPAS